MSSLPCIRDILDDYRLRQLWALFTLLVVQQSWASFSYKLLLCHAEVFGSKFHCLQGSSRSTGQQARLFHSMERLRHVRSLPELKRGCPFQIPGEAESWTSPWPRYAWHRHKKWVERRAYTIWLSEPFSLAVPLFPGYLLQPIRPSSSWFGPFRSKKSAKG